MKELFRYVYRNKFVSILFKLFIGFIVLYGLSLLLLSLIQDSPIITVLVLYAMIFFGFLSIISFLILIITAIFKAIQYKKN
ncbi:hypothetical protein ACE193_09000 [Bernardetia sp. OM2101]|uniref:hypothetical protein n=1 Tax=Bernardetia sp. OM2101 TaxID=3344876 RepID=UPI0035CEA341